MLWRSSYPKMMLYQLHTPNTQSHQCCVDVFLACMEGSTLVPFFFASNLLGNPSTVFLYPLQLFLNMCLFCSVGRWLVHLRLLRHCIDQYRNLYTATLVLVQLLLNIFHLDILRRVLFCLHLHRKRLTPSTVRPRNLYSHSLQWWFLGCCHTILVYN